jgi:methylglutaconyl-CoA hydratase
VNRIRVETDGPVATVFLARPDRKNALDREAADDLANAIAQMESQPEVRVIVLRGDGDDFCAGADLNALHSMLAEPLSVHEEDARALGAVFLALHNCGKPTVAVVRGKALAGGAGLATSCDMILAHENALFGYPEVAIGFVPAMAMVLLVRSVGERVALDLVSTGRRISAAEAQQLGLVSRTFSEADFETGSSAVIATLAAAPALAMQTTRKLLHELRTMSVADGMESAIQVNARARLTDDFRNGVLRFTRRKAGS